MQEGYSMPISNHISNPTIRRILFACFCMIAVAYAENGVPNGRPEPMIFDLVDPLGAKKGEVELNSLFDYSPRTGQFQLSPEIEYAFKNGHAIELELPVENTTLNEYKVALQGTLGKLFQGRMIHGWQTIGRRKNDEKEYGAELLYLNDYKFSEKWSMMNMFGFRRTAFSDNGEFVGLSNNSLFYKLYNRLSLGVELNSEITNKYHYRLTPQIQYAFTKNASIQFGGGPSQLNEEKRIEWLVTSRLIYDF